MAQADRGSHKVIHSCGIVALRYIKLIGKMLSAASTQHLMECLLASGLCSERLSFECESSDLIRTLMFWALRGKSFLVLNHIALVRS